VNLLDIVDTNCAFLASSTPAPSSPVQVEACHGNCTWIVLGAGFALGLFFPRVVNLILRILRIIRSIGGHGRMEEAGPRTRGVNQFGELDD